MNNTSNRLGTIFNRTTSSSVSQNTLQTTPEFTTFLTLVGCNLAFKFPLDQIDNIEPTDIERVAELAIFSVPIVVQTWNRYVEENQSRNISRDRDRDRDRDRERNTRVAG